MYEVREADVIAVLRETISSFTKNFEILVYERENISNAVYKALFAIRMRNSDIDENLIAKIKYLNAREGRNIVFEGSKIGVNGDLEVSFLFISAEIVCKL